MSKACEERRSYDSSNLYAARLSLCIVVQAAPSLATTPSIVVVFLEHNSSQNHINSIVLASSMIFTLTLKLECIIFES